MAEDYYYGGKRSNNLVVSYVAVLSNDSWAVCRFGCFGINGRWINLSWFEGVEISE